MTRREAREQALAMIFEMNFNDNTVGEMVDNALIFRDEAIDPYAAQIAQQVRLHWTECIAAVGEFSKKWKASRLPKVSLSILLMAIAEIRYLKDAPVGAVINEAVELAKKYAAPEDAAYINGVLGGYVRGSQSDGEASPEEAVE